MAVPSLFYESEHMRRKLGPNWQKQPGCHSQTLIFNVVLDKIVIDERHLILRVMDHLESGFILEVVH